MEREGDLTLGKAFSFYYPLAISMIVANATTNIVNAGLARTLRPEQALAAFGVAYGIVRLLFAPMIMMQDAAIALVKGKRSFERLRNFSLTMGLGTSLLGGLLCWGYLGFAFLRRAFNLEGDLAAATLSAIRIMAPLPLIFAYSRFCQGMLIKLRHTKGVGTFTSCRMILTVIVLVLIIPLTPYSGAAKGAISLILSFSLEAILLHFYLLRVLRNGGLPKEGPRVSISYGGILKFYLPLMLRTSLNSSTRPVISAFIVRMSDPETSLAAYSIVLGIIRLFSGPIMILRRVSMVLIQGKRSFRLVRLFGRLLGVGLTGGLIAVAFSPLIDVFMANVMGVTGEVEELAVAAFHFTVFMPIVFYIQAFYQGILLASFRTISVSMAALSRLAALVGSLAILSRFLLISGAIVGVGVLAIAFMTEATVVYFRSRPLVSPKYTAHSIVP